MSKKPISQKRAEREEKENLTLRRVFNAFLLGLAAECYLLIVYRGYVAGYVDTMLTWYHVLRWGALAGLIAAVVGGVILYLSKKKTGKKARTMSTAGSLCLGIGLFLAVSGWIMTLFMDGTGVTAMCILVPVVTVLALVYLLYQHECFLCTTALACVLFTVWIRGASAASVTWGVPVIVGAVVGAVLLAAAAALVRKVQQNEGKLKDVRIFSVECDYRIVYATLGAGLVCVLAALALPGLTYYVMWVAGILLFAELVYYTTKLM